jgi:hypothetical protein
MIKFSLRCDRDHAFESWFRDNGSYDELTRAGHLACPECGSTQVSKALMTPAVVTSRKRVIAVPTEQPPAAPPAPVQPVVAADERSLMLRAMLREMRDHVLRHAKDVGAQFAEEARRIHEGVSDETAIRGTASREDVEALLEEGIEVMPLPVFPDDRN